MPRKRFETIYLGSTTVEILATADTEQCATLTKAILEWCRTGEEPVLDVSLRLAWAAIRYESIRIHDAQKESRDRWNLEKRNKGQKGTEKDGKVQKGAERSGYGWKGDRDGDGDGERDEINPDVPDVARARATQAIGSSIHRSSVEFSSLVSSFSSDPVDDAMIVCKTAKKDDRRCFGKFLKDLGQKEFTDVVRMLQSEINAGEIPDNRAACLVAKLKDRATVLRAMA